MQADREMRNLRPSATIGISVLAIVVLSTGCALKSRYADQFVIAHKDGYPVNLQRQEVSEFDRDVWEPIRDGINRYINTVDAENKKRGGKKQTPRLLLHVHGGLTTYQGALKHVAKLRDAQEGAKGEPARKLLSEHHLLLILWDSSFGTSVFDDLVGLRFGERHPAYGAATAPFTVASRLGRSGFLTPQSWLAQGSNAVDGLIVRERRPWTECAVPATGSESDKWVIGSMAAYVAFYPIRALSVPVIQGFGGPAWDIMKRRAELILAPLKAISLEKAGAQGAGRLLMDRLKDQIPGPNRWRGDKGAERDLAITLVGHSMGTMVLNNILEQYSELYFDRIVYLAAAARLDDVQAAVVPYLRRHRNATFWSFSLSETREAVEWDYADMFDRGSLLVWIDHYLQPIYAPGDRTFGRAKNIRQYVTVPDDLKGRFLLAKFANGQGDPERHGDFSEPRILERVLEIVDGGTCPGSR